MDTISRGGGGPHACAKDAAHIYRERSSSGMMQLWPLHNLFNFRRVTNLGIIWLYELN
jgi:hypothetical protein